MKKFLIVGASGFIGSNILNLLPIKIDLTIVTSKKKKIIENHLVAFLHIYIVFVYICVTNKNTFYRYIL